MWNQWMTLLYIIYTSIPYLAIEHLERNIYKYKYFLKESKHMVACWKPEPNINDYSLVDRSVNVPALNIHVHLISWCRKPTQYVNRSTQKRGRLACSWVNVRRQKEENGKTYVLNWGPLKVIIVTFCVIHSLIRYELKRWSIGLLIKVNLSY